MNLMKILNIIFVSKYKPHLKLNHINCNIMKKKKEKKSETGISKAFCG
jgi:hypothetical protein